MNSKTAHLDVLLESIRRDGMVIRRPGGDAAIFDPIVAARVEAANSEALYVGDSLIDRIKPGGVRKRVRWNDIRAALIDQNRRLSSPRHVELLYQRMRAFLETQTGQEQDLTLLVGRAVSFALIPQIVDGLSDADLRLIEGKQEAQILKFLAPRRSSLRLQLADFVRLRKVTRIFSREIRHRLEARAPAREDFLQALLPFVPDLGVNRVAYLVTTVLTAASVAPEFTAACLVYAMQLHPDWRGRIDQEMSGIEPRALYSLPIDQLPATSRFIKEATRMWPFPFEVTRTAASAIAVDGVDLCRGARYDLSAYVLHHLDEYWERPDYFDPDRWLAPRLKGSKGSYLPFGFAPRSCVGAAVGHALLFLVCELFTRSFRVDLADGAEPRLEMPGIAVPVGMIGRISANN